jgi:hypothetical protein
LRFDRILAYKTATVFTRRSHFLGLGETHAEAPWSILPAARSVGIQISSLRNTAAPLPLTNRVSDIGETKDGVPRRKESCVIERREESTHKSQHW